MIPSIYNTFTHKNVTYNNAYKLQTHYSAVMMGLEAVKWKVKLFMT